MGGTGGSVDAGADSSPVEASSTHDAALECGNFSLGPAASVPVSTVTGSPPAEPTGGTIASGVYILTNSTVYAVSPQCGASEFPTAANTAVFDFAADSPTSGMARAGVINANGQSTFITYSYTTKGTSLILLGLCITSNGSTTTFDAPIETFPTSYSVTPTGLTFYSYRAGANGDGGVITHDGPPASGEFVCEAKTQVYAKQ